MCSKLGPYLGRTGRLGEFECMNALTAMAKRLSVALNAMDQASGLWVFMPATAKNAQERERALVLSAAGQASFRHRHNQTDPLPARMAHEARAQGLFRPRQCALCRIARRRPKLGQGMRG